MTRVRSFHRARPGLRLLPLTVLAALAAVVLVPSAALPWAENVSGYQEHKQWIGNYASTTNLLNENTSFEVGDASISALDGCFYFQRTFARAVDSPSTTMRTGYQGFSFDGTVAAHGTRSLKIALNKPYYPGGETDPATAHFRLSWEYATVPADSGGFYEISFYASASVPTDLYIDLIRVDASGNNYWEWLQPMVGGSHEHATITVQPGALAQYRVWTRDPLVGGMQYNLVIYGGDPSTPEWTPSENTVINLDAVQFTKQGAVRPKPFAYNTTAEELFLSLFGGVGMGTISENVLTATEAGAASARVLIYQDPSYNTRLPGTIHWKLYSVETGEGTVLQQGTVPVSFVNGPRQTYTISFNPALGSTYGVYKLIAEYVDGYGIRADRQEMSFAIVRDPVPLPEGVAGNFGLHTGMNGSPWASGVPPYRSEAAEAGRFSLHRGVTWAARLGFSQERLFGAFNYGSSCDDPPCATKRIHDFHATEDAEHGLTITPVINTMPLGFNENDTTHWSYYRDFLSYLWNLYGPAGTSGQRMSTWIIRNEEDNDGSWDVTRDARYILNAHQVLGSDRLMTSMCNGTYIDNYLHDLLPATVAGDTVGRALEGLGINRYQLLNGNDYWDPEYPVFGYAGLPYSLTELRTARFEVQKTPFPTTIDQYAVTETGCDAGWLLADRLTGGHTSWSGSLAQARSTAAKMIRMQLLFLGDNVSPIFHFVAFSNAPGVNFGLAQGDGMPTGVTAAQAQLNAELGAAVPIRLAHGSDMQKYNGGCLAFGDPFGRAVVLQDGTDYVIAAWQYGSGVRNFCVTVDPDLCTLTAKDMEGNAETIDRYDTYFVMHLTTAPIYVRIAGSGLTQSQMLQAIDKTRPLQPTWDAPDYLGVDGENIWARFTMQDRGDLDKVRLYYRSRGAAWAHVEAAAWAKPDSAYTLSFPATLNVSYEIKAVGVEKTTGLEGTYTGAVFYTRIAKALDPPTPPVAEFRDELKNMLPSPSRGATRFLGTSSQPGTARLEVFDVAGRMVRVVEKRVAAGPFTISWDRTNTAGGLAPSGMYFVRVYRDDVKLASRRLVVLE